MFDFWLMMGTMIVEGPDLSGGLFDKCMKQCDGFQPKAGAGFYENNQMPSGRPDLLLPHYGYLPKANPDPTGKLRDSISGHFAGGACKNAVAPVSYYTASKIMQLGYFDKYKDPKRNLMNGLLQAHLAFAGVSGIAGNANQIALLGVCIIDSQISEAVRRNDSNVFSEFKLAAVDPSFQTALGSQKFTAAQKFIAQSWGRPCGETMKGYANAAQPQIVP